MNIKGNLRGYLRREPKEYWIAFCSNGRLTTFVVSLCGRAITITPRPTSSTFALSNPSTLPKHYKP